MREQRTFWDKLRILVTNTCNYRCPFCHNEGQSKSSRNDTMNFEDFKTFIDYLHELPLSEIHFSGGEPFLHSQIVDMIEYVDRQTNWGIGCATNLSRITREQIERLASTRVKFNIQFPYANSSSFRQSTGNGQFDHILNQIKNVRSHGIPLGLNMVVQNNDMTVIREMIDFTLTQQLPLKLLPQIGLEGSQHFHEQIYPLLEEVCIAKCDKGTGAIRWTIEKDGHRTHVLYIDSPCFDKDIEECRSFGELRIHPDFSMQTCILKDKQNQIDLTRDKEYTISQMTALWNDFKHC
ncbi:MAG: radical SAM protein [Parabacteroides sp.]